VCGWQVKLCDPLVTRGPYLSALEIRRVCIKRYINSPSLLYFLHAVYWHPSLASLLIASHVSSFCPLSYIMQPHSSRRLVFFLCAGRTQIRFVFKNPHMPEWE